MTRARNSANLASHGNLFVDITNDRTGIGSVVPDQNLHVAGTAGFHADVTFTGDLYNTNWDRSDNSLKFADNAQIKLGTGNDAKLRHDGSNTWIQNLTGYMYVDAQSSSGIRLISQSHWQAGAMAAFYPDGGVVLYHDANQKFSTTAYGTNTTGTAVNDGLVVAGVATVTTMNVTGVLTYDDVTSVDSVGIVTARAGVHCSTDGVANGVKIGAGQDLILQHNGTNSFIDNNTGDLYIQTTGSGDDILIESADDFTVKVAGSETAIQATGDGEVELYHNNNLRVQTQTSRTVFRGSSGIAVYGDQGQNQNGQISIHPQGNAVYSNLLFYNAAGNAYASIIGHAGGTLFFTGGTNSPLRHRVNGSGFHSFQDGNTERVRITVGGEVNIGGNLTQTTVPLCVTTDANDFGIRLITGSNAVCDILNNDAAGNCEIRGYYNNNSGTRGEGFRLEANGETFFSPGGNSGLNITSNGNVVVSQTLFITDRIQHHGDNDTTIRFPAADQVSIETAGSERLNVSASQFKVTTNIGAGDFVSHWNNTSLGIKFYDASGSNKFLGLAAEDSGTSQNHATFKIYRQGSSVNRAYIDGSGNFGIEGKLKITDIIEHAHDSNTKIRFPANDTITFETSGTEKLRIDSSGRTLIGRTTGNSANLLVQSGAQVFAGANDGNSSCLTLDYNTATGSGRIMGHASSGGSLEFYTNASGAGVTPKLYITSSGFVGISEDNPKTGLTIAKLGDYSTDDGNTYYMPVGKWSSAWNEINVIDNSTDYWVGFVGGYTKSSSTVNISLAPNRGNTSQQAGMYISGEATGAASADFTVGKIMGGSSTGQGTSGNVRATKSELLRLKSDGKLLVGTTTEGYASADDLTVATTGSTGITIRSGTSSLGTIAYSDGTSGDAEYRGFLQYAHDVDALKIGTAGAEKVRIDSNGNFMIGRTSASKKFSVRDE